MMQRHLTQGEIPLNMIRVPIDSRPRNYFAEVHNWCVDHCNGEWTTTAKSVWFEDEEDAILFKLSHT